MFSQLILKISSLAEYVPYQNDLASHSPSSSVYNAISSVIVRCSKDSFTTPRRFLDFAHTIDFCANSLFSNNIYLVIESLRSILTSCFNYYVCIILMTEDFSQNVEHPLS
jgi:hypothetical protein